MMARSVMRPMAEDLLRALRRESSGATVRQLALATGYPDGQVKGALADLILRNVAMVDAAGRWYGRADAAALAEAQAEADELRVALARVRAEVVELALKLREARGEA